MKEACIAGLAALLFPTFVSDSSLDFSNSVFSLVFFAALYTLLRHTAAGEKDSRMHRFTHVLGLLFSVLTAFGYALGRAEAIPYGNPAFILSILLYAHVYAQGLKWLWTALEKFEHSLTPLKNVRPPPAQAALSTR